ncbi:putative NTF2-like domain superfamily protein [Helianthus annuus]|nr:putative NTF2-like domain superfamily protein [Helianthus annuus]KAJ0914924.1 putative NTF2-like domain superfamily protein [Helianthus annuus]
MRMKMAGGICCFHARLPLHPPIIQPHPPRFRNGIRCSKTKETPQILKFVVSGATEILRLFSSFNKNELNEVVPEQKYETAATCLDDVMIILKSDYDNAYFVTGNFTSGIYAEDCIFEDPTIRFSGRDLYSRNLKLLVPFFDHPSISLQGITKVLSGETESVKATWKLRTYLKLPWRPLISVDGTTVYDLDNQFRIVKHVESWSVSPLEAIGQIFTPSSGRSI